MTVKNVLLALCLITVLTPGFCYAWSTTTVKNIQTNDCDCYDTQYYLGQGIVCDKWRCTGSSTDIVVIQDVADVSVSLATSATTTDNTNMNYIYGFAVIILLLAIIILESFL